MSQSPSLWLFPPTTQGTMNGIGAFAVPNQSYSLPQKTHSEVAHQIHWSSNGQIAPGTITYTTFTNADGQVTSHPFRAVPVSYQTSQGIMHALQWVPTDATQILLTGTQFPNAVSPTIPEFCSMTTEHADQGLATGPFGPDPLDREDGVVLEKWYDRAPYRLAGASSIPSTVMPQEILPSTYPGEPPPRRPPSPHPRPPFGAPPPYYVQQSRSPYPPQRAPSPPQMVYPHGHIFAGQPIVALQSREFSMPSRSRMHSTPRMPSTDRGGRLHSFSALRAPARQPNAAQPYTPFGMMKIQNMEEFYIQIPSMPPVLNTHDVDPQEWSRFMNYVALVWTGKVHLPEFAIGLPPKRSSIVADVINLWNNSFFLRRRIEIVLYKGCERRSGPLAGTVNDQLPLSELERAKGWEREYSLYLTYFVDDHPTSRRRHASASFYS